MTRISRRATAITESATLAVDARAKALRFGDFTRATRSRTLVHATAATRTVLAAVRTLLAASRATIDRRGLTLVGVTVANLDPSDVGTQLELPLEGRDLDALDAVVDEVRRRIGPSAVTRATNAPRRCSF